SGTVLEREKVAAVLAMGLGVEKAVLPIDVPGCIVDALAGKLDVGLEKTGGSAEISYSEPYLGSICTMVAETGADFGYTEFGPVLGGSVFPDPILTSINVLRFAEDHSLAKTCAAIPDYGRSVSHLEVSCTPLEFSRVLELQLGDMEDANVVRNVGWRVELDGGWFYIRLDEDASVAHLICESSDKAFLVGMEEVAQEILQRCAIGQ
ncbi:MAG: hypothetical protein IJ856_00750, partial [Candidatus Methanomethylophilaceae archaeon]|nr:hypothetical protein [Candidatus Methanomethylophilaceae archaeon]